MDKGNQERGLLSRIGYQAFVPGSVVSFVRQQREERKVQGRSNAGAFEDYTVAALCEGVRLAGYGYLLYNICMHFSS